MLKIRYTVKQTGKVKVNGMISCTEGLCHCATKNRTSANSRTPEQPETKTTIPRWVTPQCMTRVQRYLVLSANGDVKTCTFGCNESISENRKGYWPW